jgi:hypothetical protein
MQSERQTILSLVASGHMTAAEAERWMAARRSEHEESLILSAIAVAISAVAFIHQFSGVISYAVAHWLSRI